MRHLLLLLYKSLTVSFSSDRLEEILHLLSNAFVSAIHSTQPQQRPIQDVLADLARLDGHPWFSTEMAYNWCSVICENHQKLIGWDGLLVLSLRAGFRHLDPQQWEIPHNLTHTQHHQILADVVIRSGESEIIADLLCAWTSRGEYHNQPRTSLSMFVGHLISVLDSHFPFSSRLRSLIIRSVELLGYKGLEGIEVERFAKLLDQLDVSVEDVGYDCDWVQLLLGIIQSPKGPQHLSSQYWRLLVELMISSSWALEHTTYSPQVMVSLLEAGEWDKLECWIGVVCMRWLPEVDEMLEELKGVMETLFYQRPVAVWKLKQWMEQWSQEMDGDISETFHQICKWMHEVAQQGML